MSVDLSKYSLAQWFFDKEQHKCGYCKSTSGSISYGMITEELSVEDYKDLIDRGWRRSGNYCYKPIMNETCCPQYAIKCDAINFMLNKSHKKLIKKFNKFLNDGVFNKSVPLSQDEDTSSDCDIIPGCSKKSKININAPISTCDLNHPAVTIKTEKTEGAACNNVNSSPDQANSNKKVFKQGFGADPNKPPCKKAKLIRLEKKLQKMQQNNNQMSTKMDNEQKSLTDFLKEIPQSAKHKLKLKLIPTSEYDDALKNIEFGLYVKYQTTVHNDRIDKVTVRGFTRFLITSPLKINMTKMTKNHADFTASAKLFQKYQLLVHNEPYSECSPNEFYSFLVNSPLKPKPFPNGIEGPGYGSFHQQYWMDDQLIAVGVLDILPGCVSSVYFFYDPDYRDLTLGTYGSLREIQLIRDLSVQIPDLKYYYMGFYIHSCQKMRYKGKLVPSFLLCPETYDWFPIENCLLKLAISKYSRLNEDLDAVDPNHCTSQDIDKIKVVFDSQLMRVKDFLRTVRPQRSDFEIMGNLLGKKCALNIVFWID